MWTYTKYKQISNLEVLKNNDVKSLLIIERHVEHQQCHQHTKQQKIPCMHKKTMDTFNSFKTIIPKKLLNLKFMKQNLEHTKSLNQKQKNKPHKFSNFKDSKIVNLLILHMRRIKIYVIVTHIMFSITFSIFLLPECLINKPSFGPRNFFLSSILVYTNVGRFLSF